MNFCFFFKVFLFLYLFKICQKNTYERTFEDIQSFSELHSPTKPILVTHVINENKAFELKENLDNIKPNKMLILEISHFDSYA